jgi:chitin synthase
MRAFPLSYSLPTALLTLRLAEYLYMGAVIASFLMSMGNRPKAAKWKYLVRRFRLLSLPSC